MKDIIITKKRQQTELKTLLVCFILAVILNIYAIISYQGKWTELFTSIGFMVTSSVVIYAAYSVIRIAVYLIKRCLTKKK